MLKRTLFTVSALAAMAVTPATAQPAKEQAVAGAGFTSCGQYLAQRERRVEMFEMMMISWMQGYLSAYNMERAAGGSKTLDVSGFEAFLPYQDKFCRDNPLMTTFEGTLSLIRDLLARQGLTEINQDARRKQR
jgi:hypothetical protein